VRRAGNEYKVTDKIVMVGRDSAAEPEESWDEERE